MTSLAPGRALKRLSGDPMTWVLLTLTPMASALVALAWPTWQARWPHLPWSELTPLVSALIAVLTPMMLGLVLGLLWLEERENGVLLAVAVTPTGLRRYLFARLGRLTLAALPLTALNHWVMRLVPLSPLNTLGLAVAAWPLLPFTALSLLGWAHNRLQGLVLMKAAGGLVSVPLLLMALAPSPWPWLGLVLPTGPTLLGYGQLADGRPGALVWLATGGVILLFYATLGLRHLEQTPRI